MDGASGLEDCSVPHCLIHQTGISKGLIPPHSTRTKAEHIDAEPTLSHIETQSLSVNILSDDCCCLVCMWYGGVQWTLFGLSYV
jgi:hypothetical protein